MQHISPCRKLGHVVRTSKVVSLVLLTCAFAFTAQAQQTKFKRVSPPGSSYTTTLAVNNGASMVVGSFVDASGVTFEPPSLASSCRSSSCNCSA